MSLALVVVPTHEINGILEVRSIWEPIAGIFHILLPSCVNSLGITLGTAFSFPRDYPQQPLAFRPGIRSKSRLLIDKRHRNADGGFPPVPCSLRCSVPVPFLFENSTDILRGFRRGRHTARNQKNCKTQANCDPSGLI